MDLTQAELKETVRDEHLANDDMVEELLLEVIKEMVLGEEQHHEEEKLEKERRRGSLRSGKPFGKGKEVEKRVSLRKVSIGMISKLKASQHKFLSSKAPRVMISKLKDSTPSGFHNVPWEELGMKVVDKVAEVGIGAS